MNEFQKIDDVILEIHDGYVGWDEIEGWMTNRAEKPNGEKKKPDPLEEEEEKANG